MRQVLRVVGSGILGDLQLGAQKGRRDLGDQFLCRISSITEALAEFAVEAVLGAGPVDVMPISA